MKAKVIAADGTKKGEKTLPKALFDGVVHEPAMWQTVKAHLANRRQGTASTKTRSEVRGGSRKPWRQKGTGRARQGTIRAAQWAGGGVVFGPSPDRNYSQKVPKKVKWLARRSAYNARAQDGKIVLVESLELDQPKTKAIVALLEAADATGNVLILTDGHKKNAYLSGRNLQGVEIRAFGEESAYDVLWAETLLIEAGALARAGEVAHA